MVLKDPVPFQQGDQRFESSSLQRGVRAQREAEDACGRAVPSRFLQRRVSNEPPHLAMPDHHDVRAEDIIT